MGTLSEKSTLTSTLFSKSRRAILSLLFLNSNREYYTREIISLLNIGMGTVERELMNLVASGIITRRKSGNQVLYKVNSNCPIYEELKSIIVKTAGLGDVIKTALSPLLTKIDFAFIYGSFAKGTENSDSDIDLMVIGSVKHREVVAALSLAEEKLKREINPSIFSTVEFRQRIKIRNSFILDVMQSEKIMIVGEVYELELLG
jgi:uncharacterized protein